MAQYDDLRLQAALTPAEQQASDQFERSPGNLRELEAAIASERNPANRRILEDERARLASGPAPRAASSTGSSWLDALVADDEAPAPAGGGQSARAPGDWLAALTADDDELPEEFQPKEGAWARAKRIYHDEENQGGLLAAAGSLIASALPEGGGARGVGGADTGVDLARGVVGLGQGVVGLANLASFGNLAPVLERIGYSGDSAQQFMAGLYSEDRQLAEGNVQAAKGFWDTLGALGTNPSALVGRIVQSLPGTIGAGAAGGALVAKLLPRATEAAAAAGLTGAAAEAFIAARVTQAAIAGSAAAEGGLAAGGIAEQGREAGRAFGDYALPAVGGGLSTAAIGVAGGAIGRKLGIGDIEADIAARAAGGAAGSMAKTAGGLVKRTALEGTKEGVLEEMPQSAVEAIMGNLATGRPWDQDVAKQAAEGLAAGFGMGAGHAALFGGKSPERAQADADATQTLSETSDVGEMIAAAQQLAGSLPEIEVEQGRFFEENLAPQPVAPAAVPPTPQQRVDRDAELLATAAAAPTEFDRQNALAQAQTARGEPQPGAAATYADLAPMDERQAKQRLIVMRDQAGGDLSLAIVPHPSTPGKFAIQRQELPNLDLEAPAPTGTTEDAQYRIEAAALAGKDTQRREDDGARQDLIHRIMNSIESRGGVASPEEAAELRRANMGQPYDRIDESLAAPLRSEEEKLTQATGIAVGKAPRETVQTQGQQSALSEEMNRMRGDQDAARTRANDRGMSAFEAQSPLRQAARAVGQQALQNRPATPAPNPLEVVAALKASPFQRTAEQRVLVQGAQRTLTAPQMEILRTIANRGEYDLNTEQRLELQRMAGAAKASTERDQAALKGLRGEVTLITEAELPAAADAKADEKGRQPLTREMGGFVQSVARQFGKRVVLFRGPDAGVDAFVLPDDANTIYLRDMSTVPHLAVLGHEITHQMKQQLPQAYAAFEAVVARGQTTETEAAFKKDYGDDANLEELSSDLMGNRFQDPEFWRDVFNEINTKLGARAAQGVVERLGALIVKAVSLAKKAVLKAGGFKADEFVNNLDEVKAAARTALAQYALDRRDAVQKGETLSPATQPREADGKFASREREETITDKRGDQYRVTVKAERFGAGATKDNAVVVSLFDAKTGARRAFVDFDVREDGVLVAENAKVLPVLKGRGLAEAMYRAARNAGYDIAPGRVQTDEGQAMVERLRAKGVINKEAEGKRFRAGDLDLVPIDGETIPGENATRAPAKASTERAPLPEIKDAVALTRIASNLTPEERAKLRRDTAQRLVDIVRELPATDEVAAAAWGGRAKRGWYEGSARAIANVFGPDAPRFAGLLAAMSPQTSVENNLINALNTWKNWLAAGRPQDPRAIKRVMGQSVMGSKGEGSVLDAWVNNSVRALTGDRIVLSGPKVNSFMLNLLGNVQEVTNDAWMANFALVDQTLFSGSLNVAGTDPGKTPGYLAMSAKVRAAAKRLTMLTGDTWTPAEVQETVWSWAKTLYEAQVDGVTAGDLIYNEWLTDEMIRATPDFRTLFHDQANEKVLRDAGYGTQLDRLRAEKSGAGKPRADGEKAPFDSATQLRFETRAAERLEELKATGKPKKIKASTERQPISVTGIHYSQQPRTVLSSAYSGTGLKGAERERGAVGDRIYFYVDTGKGVQPESGVGGYAHRAQLDNLYDAGVDPQYLLADSSGSNAFEKAVVDAGYDGYFVPEFTTAQGAAVLLGKRSVTVEPAGRGALAPSGDKPVQRATRQDTGDRAIIAKLEGLQGLPAGSPTPARWSELLAKAAPDVHAALDARGVFSGTETMYRNDLVKAFKAAGKKSSTERQTETPEFKRWFGDSKVVDAEGKPLVVYHGTGSNVSEFTPTDSGSMGDGIYFTDDAGAAGRFAERKGGGMNVMPVYLKADRVLDLDNMTSSQQAAIKAALPRTPADLIALGYPEKLARESSEFIQRDLDKLQGRQRFEPKALALAVQGGPAGVLEAIYKRAGYDAITRTSTGLIGQAPFRETLVFRPEQIKSAIGNRGTFDPSNPDIRASRERRPARMEDFTAGGVKNILQRDDWVILTAENPNAEQQSPATNAALNEDLRAALRAKGYRWMNVEGRYGGNDEHSFVVVGIPRQEALDLGRKFRQESVLTSEGLVGVDGKVIAPATGKVNVFKDAPADFFTRIPRTNAVFSVDLDFGSEIEEAAAAVDTAPSDAQKEAGTYKKGHVSWNGLDLAIETPRGAERSGTDSDGERWSVTMPAHYGYIKRTEGNDGDHLDIYMGPNPESEKVFVIDQVDAESKKFDEHKVVLGTRSEAEAIAIYDAAFNDGKGPARRSLVVEMTLDDFKSWAFDGTKDKPLASTERGIWFSPLERALATIPERLSTQTDAGWVQWLKANASKFGVKQDEITWSGIEEFLETRGAGKIPKAELLDYLQRGGVRVEEVVLGKTANETEAFFGDAPGETKYGDYQLPGGTNYREVLLTLPVRRSRTDVWRDMADKYGDADPRTVAAKKAARAEAGLPAPVYRSSHWDQSNVLAHIRLNDRIDADGKSVLFVEEIQSDWGQEGKKRGFGGAKYEPRVKPGERDALISLMQKKAQDRAIAAGVDSKKARDLANGLGHDVLADMSGLKTEYDDLLRRELEDRRAEARAKNPVPAAPFVGKTDAWVGLALKRVVKMAVDEGYDRVAFVTGEQSAERYDLSKQVDRIYITKLKKGGFEYSVTKDGRDVASRLTVPDAGKLADVVGKELAAKADQQELDSGKAYEGLDLKVGGEGMKAFYDTIVPSVLKDVLRKVGGGPVTQASITSSPPHKFSASPGVGNDWVIYDSVKGEWVASISPVRMTNRIASAAAMTKSDAEAGAALATKLMKKPDELQQPGFDITPAMREKAAGGMPLFSRERITGDSGRAYTPAQKQLFKNTGRTVTVPTLKERVAALRKDLGKKVAQGVFDQFAPVKEISEHAYRLLRLSKGATGAVEAFMHHGKLRLTNGAYDADLSGGFIQRVGIPLRGELEDFLWWVAGNRAERLAAEDRENLFTPQDIEAAKSLATGRLEFDYKLANGSFTRDRAAAYADALKMFDGFNKNAMDIAEQSGLIDGASRPFWEHEFYVPFYRVSDDTGGFVGANIKQGVVRQSAFKQLKGGKDKLNSDLLANTLQNWAHLIDASAKNRAAKETLEAAERLGVAIEADAETLRQIGKSAGLRKNTVWFMDQGQERHFLIEDPYLLDAVNGLAFAGLRGPLMDALSSFKHWLTIGVTASPAFKVKNLIRDTVAAVAVSPLSYNLAGNLAQGIKASKRDSQTYVSSLASGGLIRFGTMLEGNASARTRQLVRMGVDKSTILDSQDKLQHVRNKFEQAFMAYSELGNRGEEVNRSALFDQLRKKGFSIEEAAFAARDLMDFSMQGSWTTVRFLTQVVPFMNARLQGMYKLGRGLAADKSRFAVVLGAVAMTSLLLMANYSDDEDWKKREDWDRDNFWWFKIGGVAYRLPKPFEIGAIASLAERGVELFTNKEMTRERFLGRVRALVGDNLSMNPIPQAVKPILDLYANKDSFTGRPIENAGMERLDPEYRFHARTSMIARGASTVSGGAMSPVQIDHAIRAYFGWLGTFSVSGADMLVRSVSSEPSRPAADYIKMASLGLAETLPTGQSRYVTEVYEQAKVVEKAYGTWRHLVKQGKAPEAAEYLKDHGKEIAKHKQLTPVKTGLARLNERIRMVERSNMSPEAKRDAIKALQAQKDQLARRITAGGN